MPAPVASVRPPSVTIVMFAPGSRIVAVALGGMTTTSRSPRPRNVQSVLTRAFAHRAVRGHEFLPECVLDLGQCFAVSGCILVRAAPAATDYD
jgi:hypothetical protein